MFSSSGIAGTSRNNGPLVKTWRQSIRDSLTVRPFASRCLCDGIGGASPLWLETRRSSVETLARGMRGNGHLLFQRTASCHIRPEDNAGGVEIGALRSLALQLPKNDRGVLARLQGELQNDGYLGLRRRRALQGPLLRDRSRIFGRYSGLRRVCRCLGILGGSRRGSSLGCGRVSNIIGGRRLSSSGCTWLLVCCLIRLGTEHGGLASIRLINIHAIRVRR